MTCIADLQLFVVVMSEVAPSTGDKGGGGGVFGGKATKRLSLPERKSYTVEVFSKEYENESSKSLNNKTEHAVHSYAAGPG